MKTTLLRLILIGLVVVAISQRETAGLAQGASQKMPVFQVDPA